MRSRPPRNQPSPSRAVVAVGLALCLAAPRAAIAQRPPGNPMEAIRRQMEETRRKVLEAAREAQRRAAAEQEKAAQLLPGAEVALWSTAHKRFVRLAAGKEVVDAGDPTPGPAFDPSWAWGLFRVVDGGGGQIALYNAAAKRFLRINGNDGRIDSSASGPELDPSWKWERLQVVRVADAVLALYNPHVARFLRMNPQAQQKGCDSSVSKTATLPPDWTWEQLRLVVVKPGRVNALPPRDQCVCAKEPVPTKVCKPQLKPLECPRGIPCPKAMIPVGVVCAMEPVMQEVCRGACKAAEPTPVPPKIKVATDPANAFASAYKQKPAVAKRVSDAEAAEDKAYAAWNDAIAKLNSLASDGGALGAWKTKEVCADVEVKISGHCGAYFQECKAWGPLWCERWGDSDTCRWWEPDSFKLERRCENVRYFDPTEGQIWKDTEAKAKAEYEKAEAAVTKVVEDIAGEIDTLWKTDRCRLAVEAMNGNASPEFKAAMEAMVGVAPKADAAITRALNAGAKDLLTGPSKKYFDEAARLKKILDPKMAQFKALFTVDNLCRNPQGLPAKLEALGLKPDAAVLGAAARPDGTLYASRAGMASAGGSGSGETPHFYMGWGLGGSLAGVAGASVTFGIVTDYQGHTAVFEEIGPSVVSDVSAQLGVVVQFHPTATLDGMFQSIHDLNGWNWEVGAGGGYVVVGGISKTYSGDLSREESVSANLGGGAGLLPASGSVTAHHTLRLTDVE